MSDVRMYMHQELEPLFVKALCRIFRMCDRDGDGLLVDAELDAFQQQCFDVPLKHHDIAAIKHALKLKVLAVVNSIVDVFTTHSLSQNTAFVSGETDAVTFDGFCNLHRMFIDRKKVETPWCVLRHFGYNQELELRSDYIQYPYDKTCPLPSIPSYPQCWNDEQQETSSRRNL